LPPPQIILTLFYIISSHCSSIRRLYYWRYATGRPSTSVPVF